MMKEFFEKVSAGIKANQDTLVKTGAGIVGAVVGYLVTGLIIDSQNPELIEDLDEEDELLDESDEDEDPE